MYRVVSVLTILFCLGACKALRPAAAGSAGGGVSERSAGGDAATAASSNKQEGTPARQVISVLLQVKSSSAGAVWSIQEVIVREGYVKKGSARKGVRDMTAYFTDKAGTRLDSAFFEPPLATRMEGPISDDGKLGTVIQEKTEGTGFVRANYQEAITELQIYNAAGTKTAVLPLNN